MSSNSTSDSVLIGVGLDTARYGHHATFLREDRQSAAEPLEFLESREGYQRFEKRMQQLVQRHGQVHFHIRVDAASQYARNLLAFLQDLPWPKTISVGQPRQNRRYREVHFPKRKSDATESHACARFAVIEQPPASALDTSQLLVLREVASRLEFQAKQSTRMVNRLHNLLSRVFPELATLQNDLKANWVLCLLEKYPTAQRIAKARLSSIIAIPRLADVKAQQLHRAATQSVAAERGPIIEEVVRESIRALRASLELEKRLEKLLIQAFRELPDERAKQVATIKGIGERTAAVLVAKIGSIDRFPTANHLTSYFGVFPEEKTSGVDREGNGLPTRSQRMSRQGNDLVRKYLWMSAWTAATFNPAVAELYVRLRQRGRRGDVALGHCMKKLLHQVFGVWKSGKPYDPARACNVALTTQEAAVKQQRSKAVTRGIPRKGKRSLRPPPISSLPSQRSSSQRPPTVMRGALSTSPTFAARSVWNACCDNWASSIACAATAPSVVAPARCMARSERKDARSRCT